MAQSIMQTEKECWVCKTTLGLEDHHIFYGLKNRKWSETYGLKVWLCNTHHTGSNYSVHFNIALDEELKKEGQRVFEEKIGTREDFMNTFGRNYLWEEEDETTR